MKKVNRILALSLALLMAMTVCSSIAAVSAEAADREVKHIVYTCPTTDNEYFAMVAEGIQAFCDEKGIQFNFFGAGRTGYDAAEQYAQFENFIIQGVDGIISCPVDDTSLQEVVKEAQDKGIVVIGQAQSIAGADGNSIIDDYQYGVELGNAAVAWAKKYLADEEVIKVCLITLDHQDQVRLRGDGMEDTIRRELPNAEITYRQKAESTEEALQVAETVLTAHPDLKLIACVNDQMALGAWQAVENLNLYQDNFYIGGGDNTGQIGNYVADPNCAIRQSIHINPFQSGWNCAEMIYDQIVNGIPARTEYFLLVPNWQPGVMD